MTTAEGDRDGGGPAARATTEPGASTRPGEDLDLLPFLAINHKEAQENWEEARGTTPGERTGREAERPGKVERVGGG